MNYKPLNKRYTHGIVAIILGIIIASTILISTSAVEAGPSVCYLNVYTGYPCPGCGLTRSLSAVGNAEFDNAWDYHPFGIPVYITLILLLLFESTYALFPGKRAMTVLKLIYKISIIVYSALLLFGIIRLFILLVS